MKFSSKILNEVLKVLLIIMLINSEIIMTKNVLQHNKLVKEKKKVHSSRRSDIQSKNGKSKPLFKENFNKGKKKATSHNKKTRKVRVGNETVPEHSELLCPGIDYQRSVQSLVDNPLEKESSEKEYMKKQKAAQLVNPNFRKSPDTLFESDKNSAFHKLVKGNSESMTSVILNRGKIIVSFFAGLFSGLKFPILDKIGTALSTVLSGGGSDKPVKNGCVKGYPYHCGVAGPNLKAMMSYFLSGDKVRLNTQSRSKCQEIVNQLQFTKLLYGSDKNLYKNVVECLESKRMVENFEKDDVFRILYECFTRKDNKFGSVTGISTMQFISSIEEFFKETIENYFFYKNREISDKDWYRFWSSENMKIEEKKKDFKHEYTNYDCTRYEEKEEDKIALVKAGFKTLWWLMKCQVEDKIGAEKQKQNVVDYLLKAMKYGSQIALKILDFFVLGGVISILVMVFKIIKAVYFLIKALRDFKKDKESTWAGSANLFGKSLGTGIGAALGFILPTSGFVKRKHRIPSFLKRK